MQGDGTLLAAEENNRCIGIIRFRINNGECWLEGLRVDPEKRRKGVGSRLLDEAIHRAKSIDADIARGLSFEWNDQGRRFLESNDFDESARFRHARAFSFPYGTKLEPANFNESLEVIQDSDEYRDFNGMYVSSDWSMHSIPGSIDELEGDILAYRDNGSVRAAMITPGSRVNTRGMDERDELVIGFMWCEAKYIGDVALDIRSKAREREMHDVLVFIPDSEEYTESLDQAGYDISELDLLYEKEI